MFPMHLFPSPRTPRLRMSPTDNFSQRTGRCRTDTPGTAVSAEVVVRTENASSNQTTLERSSFFIVYLRHRTSVRIGLTPLECFLSRRTRRNNVRLGIIVETT